MFMSHSVSTTCRLTKLFMIIISLNIAFFHSQAYFARVARERFFLKKILTGNNGNFCVRKENVRLSPYLLFCNLYFYILKGFPCL